MAVRFADDVKGLPAVPDGIVTYLHAICPQVCIPGQLGVLDLALLALGVDKVERRPWGSETRIRSCGGAVVLVDQPTEQIPVANVARTDGDRVRRFGSWRGERPRARWGRPRL